MNKRRLYFLLMFIINYLFLSTQTSFSDEKTLELSLDECIDHALRENLDLKVYHLGLRSYELSTVQAESYFDPSISLRMIRDESVTPNYFEYFKVKSIERNISNFNFALGQNLSTGANLGAGVYNTLSESNIETEKNYTSYLGFNINQPLLRGFGKKVNRANIYLARINTQSAANDLENNAINLIYEVQKAYWNFVYARETLTVREISLAQADSLLAYNKKSFEVGILAESGVLEARSALVSRQQEVLDQKNQISAGEDVLRRLLNITSEEEWNLKLIPTDEPVILPVYIDEEAVLEEALKLRPDYKNAQKAMEQNEIHLALAKNSRLPSLDLNARYNIHGSGTTLSKDIRGLGDTDTYGWQLGLLLSYPLKNRNAKADYEKKQIDIKQALLILEDFKSQIMSEIRTSIRNVNINREKIDVARLSVEVNELRLKNEEERFRNQLSTSYYVLQFQSDLSNARNIYNKALMDYTLAVAEFQKAKGTLLKDLNISIISDDN